MRRRWCTYRFLALGLVATNVAVVVYFAVLQHTDFQNRAVVSKLHLEERREKKPFVTVLLRDFESFDNNIVETIQTIQWEYEVDVVIISDKPIYPPVQTDLHNRNVNVQFVNLNIDPRNSLQAIRPEHFVNGDFVLYVPDSTNLSHVSALVTAIKHLKDHQELSSLALPGEHQLLDCYSVAADVRRWTLTFAHSNSSSKTCDFVSKNHCLLVRRDKLLQLANPFLQPFLLSFYVQSSLRHWKTAVYPKEVFSSLRPLYQDSHNLWKRKQLEERRRRSLFETLGFKLVMGPEGRTEWYGCSRDSARCFGTVINDVPDFIFQDRWTPPCCLRALRKTAKHVFKVLDGCRARYWLEGGSLLGAARSGDVIPWDYDVDIGIYRQDTLRCSTLVSAMTEPFIDDQGFVWEKAREGEFFRVQYSETNHMHVDIFPFFPRNGTMTKNTWIKSHRQDMEFPEHFLQPLEQIGFMGINASAPNHVREFLELKFGAGVIENPRYPNGHSPTDNS